MQRTLIIFKPDCVQRRLVGQILQRFEAKGLRIAALKLLQVDRTLAERHYQEHQGKPFFEGLIAFITGGPVIVGVLEGNEAIAVVRALLGATSGVSAAPGTIRGDFSISKQNNLLHGSDSEASAQREMALWFGNGEVLSYEIAGGQWVFGARDPIRPDPTDATRRALDAATDPLFFSRHSPMADTLAGNRLADERRKRLFPNLFYVVLLISSTVFTVTVLAYLVSPYVAQRTFDGKGGDRPDAGSVALATWFDRAGPRALAVEFAVMLVSGLLAMATDRWSPSASRGPRGPGVSSSGTPPAT